MIPPPIPPPPGTPPQPGQEAQQNAPAQGATPPAGAPTAPAQARGGGWLAALALGLAGGWYIRSAMAAAAEKGKRERGG